MDWIDEEKIRRDNGIRRPLAQSQHWEVNARYPGCTMERCCYCDRFTGNAGRGEDSLYSEDGEGPFCYQCFSEMNHD